MLAEQRRAARVSAAIKTAAEAIARDVTTEARQAAQQAAARVVVAVEEHHELPELVEAPKPATKKARNVTPPDTIKITLHNNPQNYIELNPGFFPCGVGQFKQIMKLVREDAAHADELTSAIIDILKRKASTCGPDQAAARRNLVALGEVKEEKSPVKVSNKPEFLKPSCATEAEISAACALATVQSMPGLRFSSPSARTSNAGIFTNPGAACWLFPPESVAARKRNVLLVSSNTLTWKRQRRSTLTRWSRSKRPLP